MKIYFVASLAQSEEFKEIYKRIKVILKKNAQKILGVWFDNQVLFRETLTSKWNSTYCQKIYKEEIKELNQADIVVIEISYPSSVNVGHILSLAIEKGKPVVALYKQDRFPIFLQGLVSERLFLLPYTDYDLEQVLKDGLKDAQEKSDVRFNFFVSPQIVAYLNWVAREKKMPRAVYLRRLIEEDMKGNSYKDA
ncbi:hypothetical protein GYA19_04945 [Candidatus Beckwithbacteria bacterium]|nr:hypothetical protein [Candidatus Beckwithbacteria bacterium]